MAKKGQMAPLTKSKFGNPLGFRTSDHFKGRTFSGKGGAQQAKFNPSTFKTQHKG